MRIATDRRGVSLSVSRADIWTVSPSGGVWRSVVFRVFQGLVDSGATVIVIEHDLDVIRSADYIIDMGPGGGAEGGRVVVCGTPEDIKACAESATGRYI